MSKIQKIKDAIRRLSDDDLAAFRAWFTEFDAAAWDRQFERDANAAQLNGQADEADAMSFDSGNNERQWKQFIRSHVDVSWRSGMWRGQLRVALGYPEDGWVLMAILVTAYNQSVVIHCSDVFEPFTDLVAWLNRIAHSDLPAEIEIDEEGNTKRLIASSTISESDIEFRVIDDEKRVLMRCRLDRKEMLQEFARALQTWLAQQYDPMKFGYRNEEDREEGYGFDLRKLDLAQLLVKTAEI